MRDRTHYWRCISSGVELLKRSGRVLFVLLLPMLLAASIPVHAQEPVDRHMVGELIDQVDIDAITCTLEHLQDDRASPELDDDGTRFTPTLNATDNVTDIVAQFEAYGLETEVDSFFLRIDDCDYLSRIILNNFDCTQLVQRQNALQNVIATLKGADSSRYYLVTAHYDSINHKFEGWAGNVETTPAPGANDNGSGVAILLETARLLSHSQFQYDIRFAALAAEEWGLLGSQHYVAQALQRQDQIAGFINIDMVGRSERDYPHIYVYYKIDAPDSLATAEAILAANAAHQIMSASLYAEQDWTKGLSGRSDQVPFWATGYTSGVYFGVVNDAANIALVDDTYHSVGDVLYEPDGTMRLSADQLESLTQLTVAAIASFAHPIEVNPAPPVNCPPVSPDDTLDSQTRIEQGLQSIQQWLDRLWQQVRQWLIAQWERMIDWFEEELNQMLQEAWQSLVDQRGEAL